MGPNSQWAKDALESERTQLQQALRAAREDLQISPEDNRGDPLDRSVAMERRDSAVSAVNIAQRKLQAIDDALTRIQTGEWGLCARCEDEISEKRLRAMPTARYCLACQEQTDKRVGRGPQQTQQDRRVGGDLARRRQFKGRYDD